MLIAPVAGMELAFLWEPQERKAYFQAGKMPIQDNGKKRGFSVIIVESLQYPFSLLVTLYYIFPS